VLITNGDDILYEKSSKNIKKGRGQQFLTASLAKQVTSVLVLTEVEKGTIKLEEKANKYLKKNQKIHSDITIHQLLSHQSGIAAGKGISFPPGTRFEYSNYGYKILGFILENVTGRLFEELASEMFKNIGLGSTFFIDAPTVSESIKNHPRLVRSYVAMSGEIFDKSHDVRNAKSNPVGGLISTASDLNMWNYLLHNGKVLSKSNYEKMTSNMVEVNKNSWYGYGLFIEQRLINTESTPKIQKEIIHYGYAFGYKATLSYFPDANISLIIMENVTSNNFTRDFEMHTKIRDIVSRYASI
jgi:CubicO group peptidase (beta-lactamase class C family)